ADRRNPMADGAEFVEMRAFFKRRAGIGDRDEMLRSDRLARDRAHPVVEILLIDIRFERAARFARYDEQRPRQVDGLLDAADLRWIGRIDDLEARETGPVAKAFSQHLGAEAGAAHPEQQRVAEIA